MKEKWRKLLVICHFLLLAVAVIPVFAVTADAKYIEIVCLDADSGRVIKETSTYLDIDQEEESIKLTDDFLDGIRIIEHGGLAYEFDEQNQYNHLVRPNDWEMQQFYVYYRRRIILTLDANGGSCPKTEIAVMKSLRHGKLPLAERKGYLFDGWYTKKKGGKKVTADTIVQRTGNGVLYARWEKIQLKKVAVTSAKSAGPAKAAIKWEKVSGAKGYEITYAYNKKFKNPEKKTVTKNYVTLKKLEKGKTCYVKVQAYKKDSTGEKTYGKYSEVQKIEVK